MCKSVPLFFNIRCRYFKRLLQTEETSEDLSGAMRASVLDTLMDSVSLLLERRGTTGVDKDKAALVKSVASRLANQTWISSQSSFGVEDVLVWRFLFIHGKGATMPKTVNEWLARCGGRHVLSRGYRIAKMRVARHRAPSSAIARHLAPSRAI